MATIKNNISVNATNNFQNLSQTKYDECNKEKMTNIIII